MEPSVAAPAPPEEKKADEESTSESESDKEEKKEHKRHDKSKHHHSHSRSHHHKKEKGHKKHRKDEDAESSSSSEDSSSDAGSDSESSDEKHHKHKHHKHKHHHKKHHKKSKKEESPNFGAEASFGEHGVLRESDLYVRKEEFRAWAMDQRKIEIDSLPQFELKKLFLDYMEDYNTSTFPKSSGNKYYNLEQWMQDEQIRKALEHEELLKKGLAPEQQERTNFDDDEAALRVNRRFTKRAQMRQDALNEQASMIYNARARELDAMAKILGTLKAERK
ncbi:hypothetical protein PAPYR_1859 [Paratrimastix pyriformis]|uniref:Uncharacterized protein n=1 Tax=Paratrimastix pyriformis TaxID=342808 RepID=A0ABQ8URG2_9EUKA|nr:hypothetical protein PAPYR_1859 [Paratrimastix pyriformis]